jgi:hypothetical protein
MSASNISAYASRIALLCTAFVVGLILLISLSDPSTVQLGDRVNKQALNYRRDRDWDYGSSRNSVRDGMFDDDVSWNRFPRDDERDDLDWREGSSRFTSRYDRDVGRLREDRKYMNDDDSYRPYHDDLPRRADWRDEESPPSRAYSHTTSDRFRPSRWDPDYEWKRQEYRGARLSSPEIVDWEMDMERGLDRLNDDAETLREREDANLQLQEHWLGLLHGRRWDGAGSRDLFTVVILFVTLILTILMCACLSVLRYFRGRGYSLHRPHPIHPLPTETECH